MSVFPEGYSDIQLPAGLRCRPTEVPGWFFLEELPHNLFPAGSVLRHDATHYGIRLRGEDVETIPYVEPDVPSSRPLTSEDLFTKRAEARCPYATAVKRGERITLSFCADGTYEVTRGVTVVYAGGNSDRALAEFKAAWETV